MPELREPRQKATILFNEFLSDLEQTISNDKELGMMCRAIIRYSLYGESHTFKDRLCKFVFNQVCSDLDRKLEDFRKTCERNQKNRTKDDDHSSPLVTTGDHSSQVEVEVENQEKQKGKVNAEADACGEPDTLLSDEDLTRPSGTEQANHCIALLSGTLLEQINSIPGLASSPNLQMTQAQYEKFLGCSESKEAAIAFLNKKVSKLLKYTSKRGCFELFREWAIKDSIYIEERENEYDFQTEHKNK